MNVFWVYKPFKTFSKVIYYGKTIRLRYFSRQLKGQTMNEALKTRLITRLITDYKEKITFELADSMNNALE